MNNVTTKWGALAVASVMIGMIIFVFVRSTEGVSTLFSDHYLPKKYIILQKYPVRIILYGQFPELVPDHFVENNISRNRSNYIIDVIRALNDVKSEKGSFGNQIDINVNANFNSRQIRSSDRSIKVVPDNKGDPTIIDSSKDVYK